ncbi:MAG: hypothetical protein VW122_14915, partial [Paracoccaceae bacterium]
AWLHKCNRRFFGNGRSDERGVRLLLDVLGPLVGAHTRTAVGAASMPFGVAAEVEAEFWVDPLGLS